MPLRRVVVLAGGASTRLGHDKTRAELGGVAVLDHLLLGLAHALPGVPVTVVGDQRPTAVAVQWCREDPPGGGPVAGIAAITAPDEFSPDDAMPHHTGPHHTRPHHTGPDRTRPDDGMLAVLAGDLPFAAPAVPRLAQALDAAGPGVDTVLARDAGGRDQLLLGVHRWARLRAAIGADARGRSVRSVLAGLVVRSIEVPSGETLDIDTPADLERARQLALGWA